jgi:hypothetical protein
MFEFSCLPFYTYKVGGQNPSFWGEEAFIKYYYNEWKVFRHYREFFQA